MSNGYRLDCISLPPSQTRLPPSISMGSTQMQIGRDEVASLLQKGAIIPCPGPGFVSSMFVIPKKVKGYRPIINLKPLNQYLVHNHFKMEGFHTVKHLNEHGDWMVKLDLKDAFFTVPIHKDFQHYLQFIWEGKVYQYVCLPFGCASAPWLFTKLLKPAVALLRGLGIRVIVYLDDFLFLSQSREELIRHLSIAESLLKSLGFIVNSEESIREPSRCIEFLGLILDSLLLKYSLPAEKRHSIISLCRDIVKKSQVSLRDVASLLGNFSWASLAVPYASAHIRAVQAIHISQLKFNGGDMRAKVSLSEEARADLFWWISNLHKCGGKSIFDPPASMTIYSDSSRTGWGATCDGVHTGGPWNDQDLAFHINVLELKGASNAVKSYCEFQRDCAIELKLDNMTAVACVNRLGSSHPGPLNSIAVELARWCEERRIVIHASHLPGLLNTVADRESRRKPDWSDWKLAPVAFKAIADRWRIEIDLFASSWSAQIEKFSSWRPQPNSWATDAMSFSWQGMRAYAFPPFSLIMDCLSKLRKERTTVILVCPLWQSQAWFPLLLKMACDVPLMLQPLPDLLTSALGEPSPLCAKETFRLIAWKLSGNVSECKAFRTTWSNYSWPASATIPNLLTSPAGTLGRVSALGTISIPCLVT